MDCTGAGGAVEVPGRGIGGVGALGVDEAGTSRCTDSLCALRKLWQNDVTQINLKLYMKFLNLMN